MMPYISSACIVKYIATAWISAICTCLCGIHVANSQIIPPDKLARKKSVDCQTDPVPHKAPNLTLVQQSGVERLPDGSGRYNFGQVDPFEVTRLECTFTFRNDSQNTVIVDHSQSSCGCATTTLIKKGNARNSVILPGEQIKVHVILNVTQLTPGLITKYVFLMAKGKTEPVATLELTANIAKLIEFTPSVLEWGRVTAGKAHTCSFSATIDTRLLPSSLSPQLRCTYPDIQFALDSQTVMPSAVGRRRLVRCQYTATLLATAPIGNLIGSIVISAAGSRSTKPKTDVSSADSLRGNSLLVGTSLPLNGEIVGDISSRPGVVFMGSVVMGTSVTRQVKLQANSPDVLKNIHITCSNQLVSASIRPSTIDNEKMSSQLTRVVEITLHGQKELLGTLPNVIITTTNGERLVLPVILNLVTKSAR